MVNNPFVKKPKRRQKLRKIFIKLFLFCILIFIFIYFLFPYKIIKTYLVSEIGIFLSQNNYPLHVDIETLHPLWFTGIELRNISIKNAYQNNRNELLIDEIRARIEFLPLFIGRINFNGSVILPNGRNQVFISVPVSSVFTKKISNFKIRSTFKHFAIEGFADQYFGLLQESYDPNLAMLAPLISRTFLSGFLDGKIFIQSKKSQKRGFLKLNINGLSFFVDNPALNIPLQNFKQAGVDFVWDGATLNINKDTVFESENFYLNSVGYVETVRREDKISPVLNLDLLLIISGKLQKNFGFLIPQLIKCPSTTMEDGVMNVKLFGTTSHYTCQ